jgi:hypothetical protein
MFMLFLIIDLLSRNLIGKYNNNTRILNGAMFEDFVASTDVNHLTRF